ncbi:hypothetical protein FH608_005560 [Nonomuraea phyllanthi]|uniref:Uncharacterized protein n=1 Tax=Nonomuraea phyllanthi TaxID=2219224 RepID=A0A5C4WRJ7_9ACTN|nr:hypothetical protein FH608_005560 [Nonomuraea phyllanthi]
MIVDVTGFILCDCAADGVPLPGGLVRDTDRRPGQVHHFCQEPLGKDGGHVPRCCCQHSCPTEREADRNSADVPSIAKTPKPHGHPAPTLQNIKQPILKHPCTTLNGRADFVEIQCTPRSRHHVLP